MGPLSVLAVAQLLLPFVNLLRNPGFEWGEGRPRGWATGTGLPFGVEFLWVSKGARSGRRCVGIKVTHPRADRWAWWVQAVPVRPGTRYRIRGFVKIEGGASKASLDVHFRDAGGKTLKIVGPGPIEGPTKGWVEVEGEVIAPPGAVLGAVHCGVRGRGSVFFDDVLFGPVARPKTKPFGKFLPCPFVNVKVDGKLDEWRAIPFVPLHVPSLSEARKVALRMAEHRGPGDLSAKAALSHDGRALYVALEVSDDLFPVVRTPYWTGDSAQMALDPAFDRRRGQYGPDDVELGFQPLPSGNVKVYLSHGPRGFEVDKIRAALGRTGKGYVLEAEIPWEALGRPPEGPFGVSVLVNDNDGAGRKWAEWTPGIALAKDPSSFAVAVPLQGGEAEGAALLPVEGEFPDTGAVMLELHILRVGGGKRTLKGEGRLFKEGREAGRFPVEARLSQGDNTIPLFLEASGLGEGRFEAVVLEAGRRLAGARFSIYGLSKFLAKIGRLTAEAERTADGLRPLFEEAKSRGLDTTLQRATAAVVRLFAKFARRDAEERRFWEQARRETEYIRAAARRIEGELLRLLGRGAPKPPETPWGGPPVFVKGPFPEVDMGALEVRGGHFFCRGRPTFLGGFCQSGREDLEPLVELGANLIDASFGPKWVLSGPSEINEEAIENLTKTLDEARKRGLKVMVLLAHAMPDWLAKQYPDLLEGQGHFVRYDIDHPAARRAWRRTFDVVLPRIRGHPALFSIDLANEPSFVKWSGRTVGKFRRWLARHYGDIKGVNRAWGTNFGSLAEIEPPRSPDNRAMWFDWCRFNQERVTDFFRFLKREIRARGIDAPVHIKVVNERTFFGSETPWAKGRVVSDHNDGIDREALAELSDLNGCDTRIVRGLSDYAINWLLHNLALDFMRSVAPEKPIFDDEWHSVDTVYFRDPEIPYDHMRCALYLAHLHGLSANLIWWWGRRGVEPKPKWFTESLLTQPWLLDAYARTMHELRLLAPHIVKFVDAPREVRIFYSEPSAIQDVAHLDEIQRVYEALNFLGAPIGFLTERMAERGEVPSETKLLLVPRARFASKGALALLRSLCERGTLVVFVGEDCLKFDPWGREREVDVREWPNSVVIRPSSPRAYLLAFDELLDRAGVSRPIRVVGPHGGPIWGLEWRAVRVDRQTVAYLVNLNKKPVRLRIEGAGKLLDLLTGEELQSKGFLEARPLEPRLLRVAERGQG